MTLNDARTIGASLRLKKELLVERDELKAYQSHGYKPYKDEMFIFFEQLENDNYHQFYAMYHKDGELVCHA